MRIIDLDSWPRKGHYQLYSGFGYPHVNICVQVDITELWIKRAQIGASPTIALVYTITRAANRVPELRQRIQGEQVVEYEVVHPLITVLGKNDLFGVVTLKYDDNIETFASIAADSLARIGEDVSMEEFPHDQDGNFPRDDLLSITILPWLEFTGFAITRKPAQDSIPLLAMGKVHSSEDRYKLPFFVNFHHALVDGLHVARFIKYIEEGARDLADQFG